MVVEDKDARKKEPRAARRGRNDDKAPSCAIPTTITALPQQSPVEQQQEEEDCTLSSRLEPAVLLLYSDHHNTTRGLEQGSCFGTTTRTTERDVTQTVLVTPFDQSMVERQGQSPPPLQRPQTTNHHPKTTTVVECVGFHGDPRRGRSDWYATRVRAGLIWNQALSSKHPHPQQQLDPYTSV